MNREIKFRHWCPDAKEMTAHEQIRVLPDDKNFKDVFTPDIFDGVLMQFTGLKDKNGVDVYEGDIVTIKDNEGDTVPPYLINWRQDLLSIVGEGGYGEWLHLEEFSGNEKHNIEACEVIGNIYENKDLLK